MVGQRAWLASLCRRRNRLEAHALVDFDLPFRVDASMLADAQMRAQLSEVLGEVGEEYEVDYGNVCFALEHSVVLLKKSPLIAGSERAVREHLQWEAEQFLAGQERDFSVDCLLESDWGLFVAVRHSALDCYLDLGAETGMKQVDVDVPAFALYNAGECAGLLPSAERELLVYAAADEAHMLLVEGGQPLQVAVRTWDGEDDAAEILSSAARRLLKEVEGGVECAWCAGSDAEVWGADLAESIGCSMALLDPLAQIEEEELAEDFTPDQRAPYAIAVGLAQRGLAS